MAEVDDGILEEAGPDANEPKQKVDKDSDKSDDATPSKLSKFKLKLQFSRSTWIKIGIGGAVLLLLIIGAVFFFSGSDDAEETPADETATEMTSEADSTAAESATDTGMPTDKSSAENQQTDTATGETAAVESVDLPTTDASEKIELPAIPEEAPKSRIAQISESMKTNGDEATAEEDNTGDNGESLPVDELAALKAENAALKQKLEKLEGDLVRKDYILRTAEILKTQPDGTPLKRHYEKPLHIELAPKWGDFDKNVPAKTESTPAKQ